jgi:hypothetical protein
MRWNFREYRFRLSTRVSSPGECAHRECANSRGQSRDAAAALGKKDEARAAYQAAIVAAKGLDPQRQADYTKALEDSIKKL